MRNRENRSKRGIPSSPHIRSPIVGIPDIRKQEIRRLDSRNRCPVAEVVYLRLPQKSRLPRRSLLRGRLPARRPPLLQWQHQKPLPIFPRQGRVEQDHKGLCRPRGPALTRQSHRAQIGSLSLSRRPSTGLTDSDNGCNVLFLSTNPEVGLQNLLAERVAVDLVETVKFPRPRRRGLTSEPQNGLQTLGSWVRSGYTRPGRSRTLEAHRVERKLSAIFASDVEGYSRLMGRDEVGTLRTLTAYRVIIDRLIASHRGRIFNTAGDSILADFASAVDAVECAVEIQDAVGKENADRSPNEQMRFRIGIHVGDIIVRGDNLFGDAVNIAARLEALAEPGGICVSGTVRDQIGTKLPVEFIDLGPKQVKNIAQPIKAYRISSETSPTAASVVGVSLPLPDKPSIAVVPFANMSGDPEQEYFADGMVEEIITALSRIRWLFVIARNSSFTYKSQAIDVKQIGRELGVRYVLEGSVRRAGGHVRITAQLVDASTGTHLWADRFDGSLEDVFELQDKVAISVAGIIEPTLQAAETARTAGRPTDDLTAYDLYLRAFSVVLSSDKQIPEAIRLLERAIERDPHYGPALAWAAFCYARLCVDDRSEDPAADGRKSVDFARRALEVAGDDPGILANAVFALAYFGEDISAMMALVDRAVALNPSFARGWYISGALRNFAGQHDVAIEHVVAALRLSPRARFGTAFNVIGVAHFLSRRFDEAAPKLLLAIQENPNYPTPYRFLAACYAQMARFEEAREIVKRLRAITPLVVPNDLPLRKPEDRELFLSGLRLAVGEDT
jgi:TolB-like protein/class 3 adenylate cyclase